MANEGLDYTLEGKVKGGTEGGLNIKIEILGTDLETVVENQLLVAKAYVARLEQQLEAIKGAKSK